MPHTNKRIRAARRNGYESSINLVQIRRWFADEGGERQDDQQGDEGSGPKTLEDWQKLAIAREKRLKETEEKLKKVSDVNKSMDERIKAIETANNERLAKQGDFETLAQQRAAEIEKYKPLADRASALEQIIRESNEARVKNVPDAMKALIPSDYAPEKLQAWLNANEALLVKPPAPDYDAGKGGSGGSGGNGATKLTAEELETAAKAGMKPEEYAKAKAKLPQKQ